MKQIFPIFCFLSSIVCDVCLAEEPLIIDVHSFPPFIIVEDEEEYSGFDIDLWEAIANDLELEFEYHQVGSLEEIWRNLSRNQADVAIAGLTINEPREKRIDFSHRYIEAGLQILVRKQMKPSVFAAVKSILTPILFKITLGLIAFSIGFAHLVWWAERSKAEPNGKYFPGIFEWLWWVHVTIATVGYGDKCPRQWWGRAVAILVIYTGIGFFVFFTAQLSSSLTLQKLKSDISSPEDLHGKHVATLGGSTSVEMLENKGAKVIEVDKIEQAYDKLLTREADAVVFDSPNLLHYATNEGKGKVAIVGPLFDHQDYGIAFPPGRDLREYVNRSLLRLQKSGMYDLIYKKWFGESPNWRGRLTKPIH
jgi:ABC-type amino acid transport substrate-binding protein